MAQKLAEERESQIREVSGWWNLERNKKKWDRHYDGSDLHAASYLRIRQKQTIDFIKELGISQNARVLELGYGAGQTALELGKLGFEVHGMDISAGLEEAAMKRCTEGFPEGKFYLRVGNIEGKYPYEDKMFDLVVVIGALQYLYSPGDCMREVFRILKPGGYFIVTQKNSYSLSNFTSLRDFARTLVYFLCREKYEVFPSFKSMLVDSNLKAIFGRFKDSKLFNTRFMLAGHDVWKFKINKRIFSYFSLRAMLQRAGFTVLKAAGAYYCFSEDPQYQEFNLKTDRWINDRVKSGLRFLFILGKSIVMVARKS